MVVPNPSSHLIGILDSRKMLVSSDRDIQLLLRSRVVVLHRPSHSNNEIVAEFKLGLLVRGTSFEIGERDGVGRPGVVRESGAVSLVVRNHIEEN